MSTPTGRRVWAGLQLLDRQLVAHDGIAAGCIDDLELTASDDGEQLYVTAIFSGPGALSYRLNARRLGRWLRRVNREVAVGDNDDPTRIPFNVVSDIGADVKIGMDAEAAGTASTERWVRDHVVMHIPGSGYAPE
jgi:hypothetical protein